MRGVDKPPEGHANVVCSCIFLERRLRSFLRSQTDLMKEEMNSKNKGNCVGLGRKEEEILQEQSRLLGRMLGAGGTGGGMGGGNRE